MITKSMQYINISMFIFLQITEVGQGCTLSEGHYIFLGKRSFQKVKKACLGAVKISEITNCISTPYIPGPSHASIVQEIQR